MERRKYTREFKLEAVKLIRERGVTAPQALAPLAGPLSAAWLPEPGQALAGAAYGIAALRPLVLAAPGVVQTDSGCLRLYI